MFLLAQAGNIGTNHLFEPILYERLLAFGLGWVAIAFLIVNPAPASYRRPSRWGWRA